MKNDDDIRRLLRDADPAENREMPPTERARMRAMVTSSALHSRAPRAQYPLFAFGAAIAVAAIVVIALIPHGKQGVAVTKAPQTERARPTRILFTAPEGTRILWFVATPTPRS